MKNILHIIVCLLALLPLASSCDWLDVSPSNQTNEDDMFSQGDGYRNALNGLYLKLSTPELYGKDLSWGLVEVLGQQYLTEKMDASGTYYRASRYLYDDTGVKSKISSIWSSSYNGIAGCNNLIAHVSNADPALFRENEMEKKLIWGETLALRALFHFNILRLFAPAMAQDDGKKHIPYVDGYPVISTTYYSSADILAKIEADLKEAKAMVKQCDVDEHPHWMQPGYRMFAEGISDKLPDEVFFAFRGYRLNYYAITALQAQVSLWKNNYQEAFNYAKDVAEASDDEGNFFRLVASTDLKNDIRDCSSLVFTVASTTLTEDFKPYISDDANTKFCFDWETLFEGSEEDQRADGSMVDKSGSYSKKYTLSSGAKGYDMVPVIRISEMYYIMAEYYARNNDLGKAAEMLDWVRSKRGIISNSSSFDSFDDFMLKLTKEMRKELIGEGILYFHYKRLNDKTISDEVNFVFDRPENEDV